MNRKQRPYWTVVFGIVAMLSALVSVAVMAGPVMASDGAQVQQATKKGAAVSVMVGLPCHHAAKSNPACPKTPCPDLAICMAKCLQNTATLADNQMMVPMSASPVVSPAPVAALSGSLIPPLIRPPSV